MILWNMSMNDVTFEHLDAFCMVATRPWPQFVKRRKPGYAVFLAILFLSGPTARLLA